MKDKNELYINEKHSPLLAKGVKFDLAVTVAGSSKMLRGPALGPQLSTYAGLAWCISGEIETLVDDVPYRYKASEVIVIPPGVTHCSQVISEVAEDFYFTIEGDGAWNVVLEQDLWEGIFTGGEAPVERFEFLMEKISKDDPQSLGINITVAKDLMSYIANNNRLAVKDISALDIETLIRKEWNNPCLSVNYIAKKIDMHRTTASIKFKNSTGLTIVEYINKLRLTEAKRRLHNTTLSIKQIAQDCGFTDPLYFSRLFTKNEKVNPKKFRSG